MRPEVIDALHLRFDRLATDTSFEECRQLSQDVLTALVDHQGLVIALQRRALDSQRTPLKDRSDLRQRAETAFATVQSLHNLRRKIHALMAEKRTLAALDTRYLATAYARAS